MILLEIDNSYIHSTFDWISWIIIVGYSVKVFNYFKQIYKFNTI